MGIANSFSGIGLSLGVILSLSVLVQFTKNIDPKWSWGIMGGLSVFLGILTIFMVSEPSEVKREKGIFR